MTCPLAWTRAKRNFKELIANEHLGKFWILVVDREIIGYLILTFGYSFEYGGRDAFIDEFYLRSDFRNQGYGSQALIKLDEIAAELGVNAIHLEVERTNAIGKNLYAKSGAIGSNRSLLTKVIRK